MVYQPPRDDARVRLGAAVWEKVFAQGKAMSLETVFEYALSDEETTTPMPEQLSTGDRPPVLTRRQEEVAVFVARGLTNRQIASRLTLSEHTVATHVRHILKKLGLHSRTQIAAYFTERH